MAQMNSKLWLMPSGKHKNQTREQSPSRVLSQNVQSQCLTKFAFLITGADKMCLESVSAFHEQVCKHHSTVEKCMCL